LHSVAVCHEAAISEEFQGGRELGRSRPSPSEGLELQDAKARFSEVVREAQQHGPQRVTLRGKDAVVVLSADDYARLAPAAPPSLHVLLSRSPLRNLDFEHQSIVTAVRDTEL
jgi:antitoxin Phd